MATFWAILTMLIFLEATCIICVVGNNRERKKTMKTKEDEWYGIVYTCLNCEKDRIWEDFIYCPICGVKINWIEEDYAIILKCYRSGQIDEARWQLHLLDVNFKEWVEKELSKCLE